MAELRSLNIVGPSGQLDNVHFEGHGRGLALVLPGFRGGWMTAAVYYPVLALQESASDVICMESIYSDTPHVIAFMRMRLPLCGPPARSARIMGK